MLRVTIAAILASCLTLSCAGCTSSKLIIDMKPSLVLSELDTGTHVLPATSGRGALTVRVSLESNDCTDCSILVIRSSDDKINIRQPVGGLRDNSFEADLIDLTGDDVEELVLTRVVGRGTDNVLMQDLTIYSLAGHDLVPLGETGYRETGDDPKEITTEWKYERSYPQRAGDRCPALRLVMHKTVGGKSAPPEATNNLGPTTKVLSFCGSGGR
jgi:hypothetical protein